ncbi:MarR family winged helix-turn-helix transcriptional regulator [Sphingobium sp. YR768]|uniref:MarR family winged helix-turn-helix transcriptional regulator n=1 Tax=Sphingobium sp. YR768 TaxID=1884365 RepID=UPI0008CDDED7|nr:MarR family transcriptional regulator [Sphingobium sp. YR768]SER69221.1 DNA-binding transcriptional regulator, MarR family [Sphingobium sp. YR768]
MASAQSKGRAKKAVPADEAPFPQFKESLAYQAQLLARITQNDYMARITGTGIAPAQAYVLGELWFDEPLSQVELARRLDIGKATVGQTLTRLEKAGLIERRRIASDRRLIMVHLTDKGRTLREPLRVAAIDQNDALQDRIGADRMEQLNEMLKAVNGLLANTFPRAMTD